MSQRLILPLTIHVETPEPVSWADRFPGFVARGILNSALMHKSCICRAARKSGRPHESHCPVAAILNPAIGGARRYAVGSVEKAPEGITFELSLFGPAAQNFDVVVEALDSLLRHGIGPDRIAVSRVRVLRDDLEVYDSESGLTRFPGEPDCIPAPWSTCSLESCSEVTLSLASPLTLGQWRSASEPEESISLEGLGRALVHRWLAIEDGVVPKEPDTVWADAREWLESLQAADARVEDASWVEHERFSACQKKSMAFSGLQASIVVSECAEAVALGEAAQSIGLGGRTTFGYGNVRMLLSAT